MAVVMVVVDVDMVVSLAGVDSNIDDEEEEEQ